jgi:Uma2 family endonuclease
MITTRQITVDEFETMSLEGRWELVDGELVAMTPSSERSSSTGANIVALLFNHVIPNRLGRVYNAEGGFVLFPDRQTVRAPDVAFVAAERVAEGDARDHFSRLAPDLAVEVLSPSDSLRETREKVGMYLEAGARLVWLVDPMEQTVMVFRPDAETETLDVTMTIDGGDVLPGFSAPVAAMFA